MRHPSESTLDEYFMWMLIHCSRTSEPNYE